MNFSYPYKFFPSQKYQGQCKISEIGYPTYILNSGVYSGLNILNLLMGMQTVD
jgi:hypothetical protein